jgi:hypothetical protein
MEIRPIARVTHRLGPNTASLREQAERVSGTLFAGWRRAKLCGWGLGATQTSLSMLRRDESLR